MKKYINKILSVLNTDLTPKGGPNDKWKTNFYLDLYYLLESGLDVSNSLQLILSEGKIGSKSKVDKLLLNVISKIGEGETLSKAMSFSKEFSTFETHSISIGEETGRLTVVMKALSVYFEKRMKLKRQLIKVLTYPAFLLISTTLALIFMLNYVVPMFAQIFKQFNKNLPPFTQAVINASSWLQNNLLELLIIAIVIGISFFILLKKPKYRMIFQNAVIRIPIFGPIMKKVYLARLFSSLSLLFGSKVPLITSLNQTALMIDYLPLEGILKKVILNIEEGKELSKSLAESNFFGARTISLISIAERTNNLERLFVQLSSQIEDELEHEAALIGVLVEPILILLIGCIIGTILVAMYQPLFNLGNIIE